MKDSITTSTGLDLNLETGDQRGHPSLDIDLDTLVHTVTSATTDILPTENILSSEEQFTSLYGQLRLSDIIQCTRGIGNNYINLIVARTEGKGKKNIKVVNIEDGTVYYIDADSIKTNGSMIVTNTKGNPVFFGKIHKHLSAPELQRVHGNTASGNYTRATEGPTASGLRLIDTSEK